MAASTSAVQSSGTATSVRTAIARRPVVLHRALRVGQPVHPPGPEDDVGAGLGQRPREHRPEAGGGPRDDGDAAVEAEQVQDRALGHRPNLAQRSALGDPPAGDRRSRPVVCTASSIRRSWVTSSSVPA